MHFAIVFSILQYSFEVASHTLEKLVRTAGKARLLASLGGYRDVITVGLNLWLISFMCYPRYERNTHKKKILTCLASSCCILAIFGLLLTRILRQHLEFYENLHRLRFSCLCMFRVIIARIWK